MPDKQNMKFNFRIFDLFEEDSVGSTRLGRTGLQAVGYFVSWKRSRPSDLRAVTTRRRVADMTASRENVR
jgi:hypothetical protein